MNKARVVGLDQTERSFIIELENGDRWELLYLAGRLLPEGEAGVVRADWVGNVQVVGHRGVCWARWLRNRKREPK